jgi:putative toxin-antitoxin system antitoxin component (TIGR02293 family)
MKDYDQHTDKNILNEPQAAYLSVDYYQKSFADISKNYIKKVIKNARLSLQELINILPISIDTYKRKTVFNSNVTEKVLEIEEVYTKGLDAFGDSFYEWMDTTNIALGNVPPKKLLHNSFGVRILLDEIGRLEHGILA